MESPSESEHTGPAATQRKRPRELGVKGNSRGSKSETKRGDAPQKSDEGGKGTALVRVRLSSTRAPRSRGAQRGVAAASPRMATHHDVKKYATQPTGLNVTGVGSSGTAAEEMAVVGC